jgi:SAM-dependent methyltransferase
MTAAAMRRALREVRSRLRSRSARKEAAEMSYWRARYEDEGTFSNSHYETFFTSVFGLSRDYYAGKRVLDIGCGPRGSLEWASMAAERVGLDPLVDSYRELGIAGHQMTYVNSGAEQIPFPDGHFDVVSLLNSLDHVDDLDAVIAEVGRVAKPGGTLLLVVELDHEPTVPEPQSFSWDIVDRFTDDWEVLDERHRESSSGLILADAEKGRDYDHDDERERPGILLARFERRSVGGVAGAPGGGPTGTR